MSLFQNNIKKKALLGFVLKRYIYHQFILDTTSIYFDTPETYAVLITYIKNSEAWFTSTKLLNYP